MTNQELLQKIYLRLGRYKWIILGCGVALAVLMIIFAMSKPTVYTSKSSVFPLTASRDNSLANSALSNLLGIHDAPQSFSQEATINIIELAESRHTREAVAMVKLPETGNKPIAVALINSYNDHRNFWEKKLEKPKDEQKLAALGGELLKYALNCRINKNGILEINFSSPEEKIVQPISYVFIKELAQFYKDLKIRKAQLDYDFTVGKIDSLDEVLETFDRRAVQMQSTTLFVPSEKIQYQIPKENLASEKDRVMRQRDASAANREEALWRLQKVTPIIATLDKPDPPFDTDKPSKLLYGSIGLLAGMFLISLFLISGILVRYLKSEVERAVFGSEE